MITIPKKAIETRNKDADFDSDLANSCFKKGFDAGYTYRDAEVDELIRVIGYTIISQREFHNTLLAAKIAKEALSKWVKEREQE